MNTIPKALFMQACEASELDQDFAYLDNSGTIRVDFDSYRQMAMFMVDLTAAAHYQGDEQAQKDIDDLIEMVDKIRIFPTMHQRGVSAFFAGWTWE